MPGFCDSATVVRLHWDLAYHALLSLGDVLLFRGVGTVSPLRTEPDFRFPPTLAFYCRFTLSLTMKAFKLFRLWAILK